MGVQSLAACWCIDQPPTQRPNTESLARVEGHASPLLKLSPIPQLLHCINKHVKRLSVKAALLSPPSSVNFSLGRAYSGTAVDAKIWTEVTKCSFFFCPLSLFPPLLLSAGSLSPCFLLEYSLSSSLVAQDLIYSFRVCIASTDVSFEIEMSSPSAKRQSWKENSERN